MAGTRILQIPITETSNELTTSIDIVDPVGFVRLLHQSDMQLFAGYADVPNVYDTVYATHFYQIKFTF